MLNQTNPDASLGDLRSEYADGTNPHPFLTDPIVGRALSLAIDRDTLGWGQVLGDEIANVLQLRIQAGSGAFRELVNVAWHKHISSIFQGEPGSRDVYPYAHDLGEVSFSKGDSCFTLGDLISRSR